MRRRPTSPAMSLFPFLDTLVCTMGALILMLLAMTPKIKEKAQARLQAQAAAPAPAQPEELAPELDPVPEPEPTPVAEPVAVAAIPDRAQVEAERAAERQRRREAWSKTAAEARDLLAARQADYRKRRHLLKPADDRLKNLQDQILKARLKSETVVEAEQSLADDATRLEEQQERIAQKIAKTRKSIDALNRRQAASKNEYSLVPYDGTSGTVRRPIYIECTGRGYRFLPEDETVSQSDLDPFPTSYNPLLTGAQSLVRFWARRRRNSPESEPEPYVLLLVRPSGCMNYYRARTYLTSLSVNFGYELIEEDWKLSLSEPDPIAKSLLRETLDTTVQTRQPSKHGFAGSGRGTDDPFGDHEVAQGGRGSRFGSSGEDDSRGSGSGNENGRSQGRKPAIRLGSATRANQDGANGGGGGGGGGDATDGDGTGTASGAGVKTAAGGAGSGRGSGGARPAGMSGGSRFGSGSSDGNSDNDGDAFASRDGNRTARGSAGGMRGSPGGSGGGSTGEFGSLLPADQAGRAGAKGSSGANGDSGAHGEGAGDGAAGSVFGGRGRSPGRAGGSRPATLGGSSSEFDGDGGSGDGIQPDELSLPDSQDGSFGSQARGGTGGRGSVPTVGSASPNASDVIGQNPFDSSAGNTTDGSSSGNSGSGNSGLPSGMKSGSKQSASSGSPSSGTPSSSSSASNGPGSDGQGSSSSRQGDPGAGNSSAGGSSSSVQMGGPGANFRLGGVKGAKQKQKDDDDSGPRISEDDGKPGGQRGRSSGPRKWGQVGKKASIGQERRIEVRLMSDRILVGSKDVVVPVKKSDSNDEITNRVVQAISHVADTWGEPPEHYYWVPFIKFVVYPGGDPYYEKLSKVLEHTYQVNSTIDYADDKPAKKPAPQGRP